MSTSPDGLRSIGELAEAAGVTVKTVRFYSDAGLLPEAARSAGGHRRYAPDALDRLRLIRALRTLDLALPDIRRVVEREHAGDTAETDVLDDVISGQLRDIGGHIAALRWREAALRLVHDCPPGERAERIRLVGAIATPPTTTSIERFWRGWLPARLPTRVRAMILDAAVPSPPEDPTTGQVLAFARLHAAVSAPCSDADRERAAQAVVQRRGDRLRLALLYDGLAEAYTLASARIRQGETPAAGEALDGFVAAYARVYETADTGGFRRRLGRHLAGDPQIDWYWDLVAEIRGGGDEPTAGAADAWLRAALDAQLDDGAVRLAG
ncbi:MerR family transcriptional regulator [Yinghuangia aomiensis]|uniref:MerR family transcriptional regulator n=1 Tax=Yinghuangia aomiensis TaxID=676205 RepID=A0ABP9HSE0_9ACTN